MKDQLLDYTNWLLDMDRLKVTSQLPPFENAEMMVDFYLKAKSTPKQFMVLFTYTDNTDASFHEEIVIAESSEEALNAVYRNHNFHIEWHTVKELHF